MPGLQVFQYAVLTDAQGARHILGSMVDPANLSADFDGVVDRRVYQVAAAGTAKVWDAAATGEPATTFKFLWIRANVEDVFVQLVTDANGGVGDEYYTLELKKGLALILGSQASYANFTADFGGGTIDTIDEAWVSNTGSEVATVEVVVAK
jgi:hypothetical protein